nr:hypothetical protein [uncultured Sphingobacterium sp.]
MNCLEALRVLEGIVILVFSCTAIEVIKCGRMPMQPDLDVLSILKLDIDFGEEYDLF